MIKNKIGIFKESISIKYTKNTKMKISFKQKIPSEIQASQNHLKTKSDLTRLKTPLTLNQKPLFYYSFLSLLIFLNFIQKTNSQAVAVVRTPSAGATPSNLTAVNVTVIAPVAQIPQFNPNNYFNANYTKVQAYLIPETSTLMKDKTCFQRMLPVISYLSDYEQALLVRAALLNQDPTRCIDCNYYSSNLMNAIKKELANAVKLLNIESYTKRDPLRCMLNLVAMGESALNQNQAQQKQNQSAAAKANNTDFLAANATNINITVLPSNNTQGTIDNKNIVLQSLNRPILRGAAQGPLSSQVTQEVSDYLYYQALGNQCAAEFLYEAEMLLMDRRRYLCAKNDEMNNIAIFDSNNNIIAFKWTYKEAERMTDLFSNYAQCKSIENNIYPQVFNKAYGDLASNKPCQVEADLLFAQTNITNPAIQVVPASVVVVNTTTPVVGNVTVVPVAPAAAPVNSTVSVNVTTNPRRFLSEKLAYLGKNVNRFFLHCFALFFTLEKIFMIIFVHR